MLYLGFVYRGGNIRSASEQEMCCNVLNMGKSHKQTLQLVDVTTVTHSGPPLTHLLR